MPSHCLQADIGRIRQVYDAFLAEYPLCYGYWKKYADAEAKYVSLEEASLVYDRGVAAVPYSVDLWGHYAMHKQKAGAPVEEVERSDCLPPCKHLLSEPESPACSHCLSTLMWALEAVLMLPLMLCTLCFGRRNALEQQWSAACDLCKIKLNQTGVDQRVCLAQAL